MGRPAITEEFQTIDTVPPVPLGQLADFTESVSLHEPTTTLDVAPSSLEPMVDAVIGPYNAEALAESALLKANALSKNYVESYLNGLRDVLSLNALPGSNRRRR